MIVDENTKIYVGNAPIYKVYQGEHALVTMFTPVEYIESTGTQYIDTLFSADINSKLIMNYQYTNNTVDNSTIVFGSRLDWEHRSFYMGTHMGRTSEYLWFMIGNVINDRWHKSSKKFDRLKHNLVFSKQGAILDGQTIWVPDDVVNFEPYHTVLLFGSDEGGTPTPGIVRIYSCQLYDNNNLVKDFIPVLDCNNIPCLYDKIEKKMYYNQGSGQFIYE